MTPRPGHEPAIRPREKPTGRAIYYPICMDWSCDDEDDWDWIGPGDEDYSAVKREEQIAYYHEPREQWRQRLQEERDRLSGGDALWAGKPRA